MNKEQIWQLLEIYRAMQTANTMIAYTNAFEELHKFIEEHCLKTPNMQYVTITRKQPDAEVVQAKAKPKSRNATSTRFKFETSVDTAIIEKGVELRKQGLSLKDIAADLNSRGFTTFTGKAWTDGNVWPVLFSKNALKYWGI